MPNLIPYDEIKSLPLRLQIMHLQNQLSDIEQGLIAFHIALENRDKDERLADIKSEVNKLRKALGGELEPDFEPFKLTTAEKKQLKFAYHKAAWICHPDNLDADTRKAGQEWFERLTESNVRRDLLDVEWILLMLQTGEAFGKGIYTLYQLEWKLTLGKAQFNRLSQELKELQVEHVSAAQLLDSDEVNFYVYERKIELEEELEELRWQLENE